MQRIGLPSYLNAAPQNEVWEKVQQLFIEEDLVINRVAIRLGVHRITLDRWLRSSGHLDELKQIRARVLKEEIDG